MKLGIDEDFKILVLVCLLATLVLVLDEVRDGRKWRYSINPGTGEGKTWQRHLAYPVRPPGRYSCPNCGDGVFNLGKSKN